MQSRAGLFSSVFLLAALFAQSCDSRHWQAEELAPDRSTRPLSTPASCPADLPGTDAELAATPREDADAELLAIFIGKTFTADTATYERIRRDLASIREHVPELERVHVNARSPVTLGLIVDTYTFTAMEAGLYHDWDCLNARYGWNDPTLAVGASGNDFSSGSPTGRYDQAVLASLYAKLAGVEQASFGGVTGGSTICLTGGEKGVYHYVFDEGSGDCPAGCIAHDLRYLVTQAGGDIEWVDESDGTEDPRPDWLTSYVGPGHCY